MATNNPRYEPPRTNERIPSEAFIKMLRIHRCELVNCVLIKSCILKGLAEICSEWNQPHLYYEDGEDWRTAKQVKLVMPIAVTPIGWKYRCENCEETFELIREIHIPLCIDCRYTLLDKMSNGMLSIHLELELMEKEESDNDKSIVIPDTKPPVIGGGGDSDE